MFCRVSVDVLRVLLGVALACTLVVQIVVLPWLSGVFAAELPGEAYMRWPILALAIAGLACVDVGIICTLRLLGFTRRGEVFSPGALRWVDGLIVAFLAAAGVCALTLAYQTFTVAGPPVWMLLLFGGMLGGVALALLMGVMRSLLVQATTLRHELEAVI